MTILTVMVFNTTNRTYECNTAQITREWGYAPNGRELRGHWVLRDRDLTFLDYDTHRERLAKRHGYTLEGGNGA